MSIISVTLYENTPESCFCVISVMHGYGINDSYTAEWGVSQDWYWLDAYNRPNENIEAKNHQELSLIYAKKFLDSYSEYGRPIPKLERLVELVKIDLSLQEIKR